MTKSRLMSLVEAVAKVIVGYGIAVVTQVLIFPLFWLQTTLGQNLAMGGILTCVSLVRSYLLRRVLEAVRVANHFGGHDGHEGPVPPHRRRHNRSSNV